MLVELVQTTNPSPHRSLLQVQLTFSNLTRPQSPLVINIRGRLGTSQPFKFHTTVARPSSIVVYPYNKCTRIVLFPSSQIVFVPYRFHSLLIETIVNV